MSHKEAVMGLFGKKKQQENFGEQLRRWRDEDVPKQLHSRVDEYQYLDMVAGNIAMILMGSVKDGTIKSLPEPLKSHLPLLGMQVTAPGIHTQESIELWNMASEALGKANFDHLLKAARAMNRTNLQMMSRG